MKILTGLVPMVQESNNNELNVEYVKAPGKLIGTITTEREAFPCVYVDIQCLDNQGDVIYAYFSESRMNQNVVITYLINGEWFGYDSMSEEVEKLEEYPKKLEQNQLEYEDHYGFGKPEGILKEVICKV